MPKIILELLLVVYVLSYPAALRWHPDPARNDFHKMPLYRPVEWLIDRSPLQEPMFAWADLWGMREQAESVSYARTH